jgi:mRNA deadenylase 3'-5' endonuclease subunit Ccr4
MSLSFLDAVSDRAACSTSSAVPLPAPLPARAHSFSSDAPSCRLYKEEAAPTMCLRLRFAGKTTNQQLIREKPHDAACARLTKKLKLPTKFVDAAGDAVGTCDDITERHTLQIGEGPTLVHVAVLLNPPSLWSVRVPAWPHVGSPLRSEVRSSFADMFDYRWYRLRRDAPTSIVSQPSPALSEVGVLVGSAERYIPVAADVDHLLMVEVTALTRAAAATDGTAPPLSDDPRPLFARQASRHRKLCSSRVFAGQAFTEGSPLPSAGGSLDDAVWSRLDVHGEGVVAAALSSDVFHGREWQRTCNDDAATAADAFVVVSYNLLAQYNVKPDLKSGIVDLSKFADPPRELSFEHRRQRLLNEMASERYGADLICLQEVDRALSFADYLEPHLRLLGFASTYANKVNTTTPIGNAVAWRASRFEAVEQLALDLTSAHTHEANADIHALLTSAPALEEVMRKTTSVANVVLLRSTRHPSRAVCVANVHQFGDPGAPHVRLLQTALVLRSCERLIAAHPNLATALVLAGDFNCGPEEGMCELLRAGAVDENHRDWRRGSGYEWGQLGAHAARPMPGAHADVPAMALSHPFALTNGTAAAYAYSYIRTVPQWSLSRTWLVDHVFYDTKRLRVLSTLPPPAAHTAQLHGAPSSSFPSDHVAVVVKLAWVDECEDVQ